MKWENKCELKSVFNVSLLSRNSAEEAEETHIICHYTE
jgi:hypothetical protein